MVTPHPPRADIEAIRARANAATPGPWVKNGGGTGGHIKSMPIPPVVNPMGFEETPTVCLYDVWTRMGIPMPDAKQRKEQEDKDGAFIAASRQDIPTLCDEVDALRAQLTAMEIKLHTAIDEKADLYRELCSLNTQHEQLQEQERDVIAERDALRAEVDAWREAVAKFLSAKDSLDVIPDGEAGDIEIGRRAEEASAYHAEIDDAIDSMRELIGDEDEKARQPK